MLGLAQTFAKRSTPARRGSGIVDVIGEARLEQTCLSDWPAFPSCPVRSLTPVAANPHGSHAGLKHAQRRKRRSIHVPLPSRRRQLPVPAQACAACVANLFMEKALLTDGPAVGPVTQPTAVARLSCGSRQPQKGVVEAGGDTMAATRRIRPCWISAMCEGRSEIHPCPRSRHTRGYPPCRGTSKWTLPLRLRRRRQRLSTRCPRALAQRAFHCACIHAPWPAASPSGHP